MPAFWLIPLILVAAAQAPSAPCTLAGPAVEAHWSSAIPPAPEAEAPLRVVTDIPLPGSASRFDYQSLEPASGRLFISHMGAGQLVVFDVRAGKVIGNLDGFPTVTGVLAVPAEHRAYASAAGDHALVVVQASTLQLRQVLPVGSDPDVLAFDPALGRLFVAAESGVVAVFDERDGSLAQLGWYRAPKAHSVAVDPATHHVYLPLVNVNGHPVLRVLAPKETQR